MKNVGKKVELSPSLLKALQSQPKDETLRFKAAGALKNEGKHGQAARLLIDGLINLTGHDDDILPCLCKRCIRLDEGEASADGHDFEREFAVSNGRVLFYWVPREILNRNAVAHSVAARMKKRLTKKAR